MQAIIIVFFDQLPELDTISDTLKASMGLELTIRFDSEEGYMEILYKNPDLLDDMVEILVVNSQTRVFNTESRDHFRLIFYYDSGMPYLAGAVAAVMLSIGGRTTFKLPDWAYMKWQGNEWWESVKKPSI